MAKWQPIKPVKAPKPIRLTPTRTPGSERLDGTAVKPRSEDVQRVPPFEPWTAAMSYLRTHWRPGQHMSLVARTRSGKTTAARRMLDVRDWVVVFGTKAHDPDLYEGFQKRGYVIKETWTPEDLSENRVILKPPLGEFGDEDFARQKRVFQEALRGLFRAGGWCLYLDEAKYISEDLGLRRDLDRLWLQGGSHNVSIVAATQRPRSVPLNMFEQMSYLCAWRISDREDRYRAAEMLGPLQGVAFETMAMLPRYEFLLADLLEDRAFRTKVV